jgi:hypothetical protein
MSLRWACANGHIHGSTMISTASTGAISIALGDFVTILSRFEKAYLRNSARGAMRKILQTQGGHAARPQGQARHA